MNKCCGLKSHSVQFKGHALERTSKLVAWWSPNHDLEQNGNAHPNSLKKKKKTKPKPIFRPDNH